MNNLRHGSLDKSVSNHIQNLVYVVGILSKILMFKK